MFGCDMGGWYSIFIRWVFNGFGGFKIFAFICFFHSLLRMRWVIWNCNCLFWYISKVFKCYFKSCNVLLLMYFVSVCLTFLLLEVLNPTCSFLEGELIIVMFILTCSTSLACSVRDLWKSNTFWFLTFHIEKLTFYIHGTHVPLYTQILKFICW